MTISEALGTCIYFVRSTAHRIGFTAEITKELSDLLELPGTVIRRERLQIPGKRNGRTYIIVETEEGQVIRKSYPHGSVPHLHEGDTVTLVCKEILEVTRDYVPPNLARKVPVSRKITGYKLINIRD